MLYGCASTYRSPDSDNTASLKFVLKKPLENWMTISFFEELECLPSPHGEYAGDLHNGSWTQKSSEELTFKIDSGKLFSMELFERIVFTSEMVHPGQYCKNLLAFTPEKDTAYLIEYWPNCKYTFTNQDTGEEVQTLAPTGKCHSKNIMGAASLTSHFSG
jgi:hypothetical protein